MTQHTPAKLPKKLKTVTVKLFAEDIDKIKQLAFDESMFWQPKLRLLVHTALTKAKPIIG